jgi:hypothetical protein
MPYFFLFHSYPELNSNCPYPPLLTNPLTDPSNSSNASSIPQPSAPTSSQQPQDCPPGYEDAMNLIKK